MPLLLSTIAYLAIGMPLQQTPTPDTPVVPPPVVPAPVSVTARVAVQITNSPTDSKFEEFLKSLPTTPVQIDPIALQTTLAAATAPVATDTPLAAKLRMAYLQLTPLQRLNNEPNWKYYINPILWLNRTKSASLDWWRIYKTTLPIARSQISEVYPFAYDMNTAGDPAHSRARMMMNQGIDFAMGQGDFVRAEDLLYKAVTADPTYSLAPYNAGVLQMCRYNAAAAITMFNLCNKRNPSPIIQEHTNTYKENMRRLIIMLLNNSGSQRRIYSEYIDAAWALYNLGEFRAAAVFAGQAAALDPDESRPEAHFLIAMICAQQNNDVQTARWLQYALERCKGSASRIVGGVLKDAQTSVANPAPAAPAAPAPEAPAPVTPAPEAPAAPGTLPANP